MNKDQKEGYSYKGHKIFMPVLEVLHPLGIQFHHVLSPLLYSRPIPIEQERDPFIKKGKKDGGEKTGDKRLGEKKGEK